MSLRTASVSPALLAGAALAVGALSCGEVPTLPDGVAYISAVVLPSPAVAEGDTLRDSTGQVAPLRLYGISNAGDTITTITPVFLVTTLGKGVTLTESNLVIGDSTRTVQLVGQVGSRLQTPAASLDVVLQPDSMAAAGDVTSRFPVPAAGEVNATVALGVNVTSGARPPRTGVKSIVVRYAITRVFPAETSLPDTTLVLVDDAGRFAGATGQTSVDTTDASGNASRRIRAVPFGFDSVEISASANNLKGVPLPGAPIRFVVTTK